MRRNILLIFILSLTGCSSDRVPTYPVSGRIQFENGEPVRNGTIELESAEFATSASGRINRDGTFVLGTYTPNDGAAAGKHRVIVVQIIINDGSFQHTLDHGRRVPARYGNYETSKLTASVVADSENKLFIELANR